MQTRLKIILVGAFLSATVLTAADGPDTSSANATPRSVSASVAKPKNYNPDSYIQEKEIIDLPKNRPESSEVKEGETIVNGVRYRVFKNDAGLILVPRLDSFSPDDLDRATCSRTNGGSVGQNVTLTRVERNLSSTATAYAQLIQKTILAKCGEGGSKVTSAYNPKPEIGIRIKEGGKGSPGYKIYNEGLTPNVGVGAEF